MDWEENFYILRKSLCPAVLTENFFMDSHSDLEYLQSKAGKQAVVDTHVEGVIYLVIVIKSISSIRSNPKTRADCFWFFVLDSRLRHFLGRNCYAF